MKTSSMAVILPESEQKYQCVLFPKVRKENDPFCCSLPLLQISLYGLNDSHTIFIH
jgi:hypothetical protein